MGNCFEKRRTEINVPSAQEGLINSLRFDKRRAENVRKANERSGNFSAPENCARRETRAGIFSALGFRALRIRSALAKSMH